MPLKKGNFATEKHFFPNEKHFFANENLFGTKIHLRISAAKREFPFRRKPESRANARIGTPFRAGFPLSREWYCLFIGIRTGGGKVSSGQVGAEIAAIRADEVWRLIESLGGENEDAWAEYFSQTREKLEKELA